MQALGKMTMAIGEESRHHLYRRLEAVLGHEEATTLMEHLPPVGWADVATKHDVARIETGIDGLDARMREMQERFVLALRSEIHAETNRVLLWFFPFAATFLGVLTALVLATR